MAGLLRMQGITKRYPGVVALDGVNFSLEGGQVHALMGENGAGKSTLIKVLTGVIQADSGTILLDERAVRPSSPLEAQRLGISTVYQEVNLIPGLSVAENLALGRQPLRAGMIDWRAMNRSAAVALKPLGLDIDVERTVDTYSLAIQQMVAIARALQRDARILVLDEPTSSLDEHEVAELFRVLGELKARGLGIVFITHFLDQVYRVSDQITVLRNGRLVGAFPTGELSQLELVSKMLGHQPSSPQVRPLPAQSRPERKVALRATGLSRAGVVGPLDIELTSGEVLGLAGLLGSGRTETARLLFGIDRPSTGKIRIDDKPVEITSPRRAGRLGLGFAPEDRKTEAIVPNLSVRENIALALQARRGWLKPLTKKAQSHLAEGYISSLGIVTPDADKPAGQLSGGNQQKVILARWLAANPKILILDEPTRGIDVGAKGEIEALMRDLCEQGLAVLFISSEIEEISRNSDRVTVLRDGLAVGGLERAEIDTDAIMGLIAGPEPVK